MIDVTIPVHLGFPEEITVKCDVRVVLDHDMVDSTELLRIDGQKTHLLWDKVASFIERGLYDEELLEAANA